MAHLRQIIRGVSIRAVPHKEYVTERVQILARNYYLRIPGGHKRLKKNGFLKEFGDQIEDLHNLRYKNNSYSIRDVTGKADLIYEMSLPDDS